MPKPVQYVVFANPFCVEVDDQGRTHGHIPYSEEDSPSAHKQAKRFVGCHLTAQANPGTPGKLQGQHHITIVGGRDITDWDHSWEYDTEPTTLLPQSKASEHYYLDAMRAHGHHGAALLPADVATWTIVHGSPAGFRDPRAWLHQYVGERSATPHLKQSAATKTLGAAADGAPVDRDHDKEWLAFVEPAVKAEADAKAKRDKAEADAKAAADAAAAKAAANAAFPVAAPTAPATPVALAPSKATAPLASKES